VVLSDLQVQKEQLDLPAQQAQAQQEQPVQQEQSAQQAQV
jgi:hypothetical protein